ncbi:MAG: NigD-like C-terminal domain-containing protein [Bacteroidales bacterium]|nr:NigD-like C-terminal domain-containing protein [Bacteroidales bacterium]
MNKKIHRTLIAFAAALLMAIPVIFTACNDDDSDDYTSAKVYNALVTVVSGDKANFLVVNDSLTVKPADVLGAIFKKPEVRALARFAVPGSNCGTTGGKDDAAEGVGKIANNQEVYIVELDTIRTKPSTPWDETLDKQLGGAPIDINKTWMTVAEDGYLTLHYTIMIGTKGGTHSLHLLKGRDPKKPYELELRHTDRGDYGTRYTEGLVAFDIKDILPVGTDKKFNLTVRYKGFDGKEKTLDIPCCGLGKRHQPVDGAKD